MKIAFDFYFFHPTVNCAQSKKGRPILQLIGVEACMSSSSDNFTGKTTSNRLERKKATNDFYLDSYECYVIFKYHSFKVLIVPSL